MRNQKIRARLSWTSVRNLLFAAIGIVLIPGILGSAAWYLNRKFVALQREGRGYSAPPKFNIEIDPYLVSVRSSAETLQWTFVNEGESSTDFMSRLIDKNRDKLPIVATVADPKVRYQNLWSFLAHVNVVGDPNQEEVAIQFLISSGELDNEESVRGLTQYLENKYFWPCDRYVDIGDFTQCSRLALRARHLLRNWDTDPSLAYVHRNANDLLTEVLIFAALFERMEEFHEPAEVRRLFSILKDLGLILSDGISQQGGKIQEKIILEINTLSSSKKEIVRAWGQFLKGMSEMRENKFSDARRYFEDVSGLNIPPILRDLSRLNTARSIFWNIASMNRDENLSQFLTPQLIADGEESLKGVENAMHPSTLRNDIGYYLTELKTIKPKSEIQLPKKNEIASEPDKVPSDKPPLTELNQSNQQTEVQSGADHMPQTSNTSVPAKQDSVDPKSPKDSDDVAAH